MNRALSVEQAIAIERPSRLMVGLMLSLLLHGALLFAWRQGRPVQGQAEIAARRSIAVWLRPPPPPPSKAESESAKARPSAAAPTGTARPRRRAPPNVIALPPKEPDAPASPEAFTVEPPTPAVPRFDPEAARRLARQLANDPDPAKVGTAVSQLPSKPLETETKAARAIAKAARRNCKDGIPGGLLAPLYLMMDKKDSGCKW